MLTALALAAALLQTTGGVVWDSPAALPDPAPASAAAPLTSSLPDWALADPFGWERSQCSPLVRRDALLETCQARVRTELSSALGDRLPAGLRPSGEPVPCLATPDDNGAFPVQCGVPERAGVQVVSVPQARDCRSRPTRQGRSGGVAFTEDCREASTDRDGGLTLRLFGKD